MGEWSFEHAVGTRASRAAAWAFWSDLRNHMRLEPEVGRIELDGPFATGTTGRSLVALVHQAPRCGWSRSAYGTMKFTPACTSQVRHPEDQT